MISDMVKSKVKDMTKKEQNEAVIDFMVEYGYTEEKDKRNLALLLNRPTTEKNATGCLVRAVKDHIDLFNSTEDIKVLETDLRDTDAYAEKMRKKCEILEMTIEAGQDEIVFARNNNKRMKEEHQSMTRQNQFLKQWVYDNMKGSDIPLRCAFCNQFGEKSW